MSHFRSTRYQLQTDLPEIHAREALVRLEALADRFEAAFAETALPLPQALPLLLFTDLDDYERAGGAAGSAGQFDPASGRLLAWIPAQPAAEDWRRLAHEAFHQLAHHSFQRPLPAWLNEGLAEYFAEGLFVGDALMLGIVRPQRQERLQQAIQDGALRSMEDLFALTPAAWNHALHEHNYDQAWSLVVYLLHGDGGRHAPRFQQLVRELAAGEEPGFAWRNAFGRIDVEEGWSRWWMQQRPAGDRHVPEAAARVLTSYWARAVAQGQTVSGVERLIELGQAQQLAFDEAQWLPPSLLSDALQQARVLEEQGGKWLMRRIRPRQPERELVLLMPDGMAYRGRFETSGGRVTAVRLLVEHLPEDLLADFARLAEGR